ncbi:MAG: TolC family protein [Ignavibacteriales bacterium]
METLEVEVLLLETLAYWRHPARSGVANRLTAGLLVACLLAGLMTAGGGVAVAAGGGEEAAETLSLEDAVRLAIDSSPEMELARLRLAQAMLDFDTADEIAGSIEEDQATTWDLKLAREYNPVAARNALEYAERDLALVEKRVRLSVSGAYYDVLKAESMLAAVKAGQERAEKQLEHGRALLEAGKAARADVLAAETGVAAARTAVVSSEKALEMAVMALTQVAGLATGEKRRLSTRGPASGDLRAGADALSEVAKDPGHIDELVASVLPKRLDVSAASTAAEQARLYLEVAGEFYTANVWTVRQAEIRVQSADIALKQAKSEAELEVRLAYLSLLEAAGRYEMTAKTVENAAESVRISGIRYDAGVGTALECVAAETLYRQAQAEHIQAEYDFSLANARFEFITDGGQLK